jgi:hypothetical protein
VNTEGFDGVSNDLYACQFGYRGGERVPVAILNRSFDPLRPLDIVMAAQAMVEGEAEAVVFAPRIPNGGYDLEQHGQVKILAEKVFFPLFSVTDLVKSQSANKVFHELKMTNSDVIDFNWLAPASKAQDQFIIEALKRGMSLDEAVNQVISPDLSKFIYFYFEGEENEIVAAISQRSEKGRLIKLSDDLYPLCNANAALIKDGRSMYTIFSSSQGPGVSFELPVSGELH